MSVLSARVALSVRILPTYVQPVMEVNFWILEIEFVKTAVLLMWLFKRLVGVNPVIMGVSPVRMRPIYAHLAQINLYWRQRRLVIVGALRWMSTCRRENASSAHSNVHSALNDQIIVRDVMIHSSSMSLNALMSVLRDLSTTLIKLNALLQVRSVHLDTSSTKIIQNVYPRLSTVRMDSY